MNKQKILVCGATGFIGRNITEKLACREDLDIVGVYHIRPPFECPSVTWVQADLCQPDDISRVLDGVDIVIQAAATTSGSKQIVSKPYIHVTDNAVMNAYLFRGCFDLAIKSLIFFSCTVMYQSSSTPLREDDFDPSEEMHANYFAAGWTKVYNEKMCEFYARLGKTRYTVIRHSNIYGPHDKFDLENSHVFGATVTKVMQAKNGEVEIWGGGKEGRDLLFVGDLVDLVELAIEKQTTPFEIFNCGAGTAISINDLASKIISASGKDLIVRHNLSGPSIKTTMALNCAKAKRELGWEPKTSLSDGIDIVVRWWKNNIGDK